MPRSTSIAAAAVALVTLAASAAPVRAAVPPGAAIDMGAAVAADPLHLIGARSVLTRSATGTDEIEVWACVVDGDRSPSIEGLLDDLARSGVAALLQGLSGGAYRPEFRVGGSVAVADPSRCSRAVAEASSSRPDAALVVVSRPVDGSASGPHLQCRGGVGVEFSCDAAPDYPGNGRKAVVPLDWVTRERPAELLHELGHTLGWPHVEGAAGDPYGVPGDVMSGLGTLTTAAVNRYAAGWIPAAAITVARPSGDTRVALGGGAKELVVIPTTTAGVSFTIEGRDQEASGAVRPGLGGVYVNLVDERPTACGRAEGALPCQGTERLVRTMTSGPLGPGDTLLLDPEAAGATGPRFMVRVGGGQREFRVKVSSLDSLTCEGEPATILGTTASDVIRGTAGRDVVVALDGDDLVLAGAGDDLVCGGDGDDRLMGQRGADVLIGGSGDDLLRGGPQTDVLFGGPGEDRLLGGLGGDAIEAGPGADVCRSGSGRGC